MKLHLSADQEQLLLYQDKSSVLRTAIGAALICCTFGAVFIWVGRWEWVPTGFGVLFLLVGGLLIYSMRDLRRKMAGQPGWIMLRLDAAGLLVSPAVNAPVTVCAWVEVERIVVTDGLNTRDSSERVWGGGGVLVFFRAGGPVAQRGAMEGSVRQLQKSPGGQWFAQLGLNAAQRASLLAQLPRWVPATVTQIRVKTVAFDYIKGVEQLQE